MLLASKLFGIKLYDSDIIELLFRLGIDLLVVIIIIRFIYQPTRRDSEYTFTYLVFSPIIFFICHLFSKVDLSIGFAFGLFAVFSILRYRTTTIQVKEMTYMFIVIAVAVINALTTKKVSLVELAFTNLFIIGLVFILEKLFANTNIAMCEIFYEKIEHLEEENNAELMLELSKRIGKAVVRYDILEADYLKDAVRLRVYFKD